MVKNECLLIKFSRTSRCFTRIRFSFSGEGNTLWNDKLILPPFFRKYRLGGVVVVRPPRMRVIPKTLKMLVRVVLLGAQHCGVSITTDWLVSG